MSEFRIVKEATYSPTRCLTCMGHAGPFVETHIDLPGYGHVWICSTCLVQMARLQGCADPEVRESMEADLALADDRISILEGQLVEQAKRKTVTMEQALMLIETQSVR